MFLILNKFRLYLISLKILIILSNFNKLYSNIIISNFYKRFIILGFIKNNIIIIFISGSLEFFLLLKIIFKKIFFDICLLFGLLFKNKTFHYEIISLNIFYFILKLSYNYNIIFINSLIFLNNNYIILHKLLIINNINIKIFVKFLNFLYFLKKNI